jgi:hypothetical protein
MTSKEVDSSLLKNGFAEVSFKDTQALDKIQQLVTSVFSSSPEDWHQFAASQEDRLQLLKTLFDKVADSGLVLELLRANVDLLIPLVGPDIDTQSRPQVRVSRPTVTEDLIDWHRDSFYGNSPWELNIWFPVFPLREGAGLLFVPGSHVVPSKNVREIKSESSFKNAVTKGSLPNQVGYTYSQKTDDAIANLKPSDSRLLAPKVGNAILFFANGIHTGHNQSTHTRISIDTHVRNMHSPTNTKPGYYVPLHRGAMSTCIAKWDV